MRHCGNLLRSHHFLGADVPSVAAFCHPDKSGVSNGKSRCCKYQHSRFMRIHTQQRWNMEQLQIIRSQLLKAYPLCSLAPCLSFNKMLWHEEKQSSQQSSGQREENLEVMVVCLGFTQITVWQWCFIHMTWFLIVLLPPQCVSPRWQAVVPSLLEALGHQKVKRKKLEAGGSFYKIRE